VHPRYESTSGQNALAPKPLTEEPTIALAQVAAHCVPWGDHVVTVGRDATIFVAVPVHQYV
jgi:hypothetical protein